MGSVTLVLLAVSEYATVPTSGQSPCPERKAGHIGCLSAWRQLMSARSHCFAAAEPDANGIRALFGHEPTLRG
jgi:hypothetical protein